MRKLIAVRRLVSQATTFGSRRGTTLDLEADAAVVKLIQTHHVFSKMEEDHIEKVLEFMVLKQYSPGAVILKQGEKGREMYFLAEGGAEVFQKGMLEMKNIDLADPTKPHGKKLTRVDAGSRNPYFGDLALMYESRRSATVVAAPGSGCKLWVMGKPYFDMLKVTGTNLLYEEKWKTAFADADAADTTRGKGFISAAGLNHAVEAVLGSRLPVDELLAAMLALSGTTDADDFKVSEEQLMALMLGKDDASQQVKHQKVVERPEEMGRYLLAFHDALLEERFRGWYGCNNRIPFVEGLFILWGFSIFGMIAKWMAMLFSAAVSADTLSCVMGVDAVEKIMPLGVLCVVFSCIFLPPAWGRHNAEKHFDLLCSAGSLAAILCLLYSGTRWEGLGTPLGSGACSDAASMPSSAFLTLLKMPLFVFGFSRLRLGPALCIVVASWLLYQCMLTSSGMVPDGWTVLHHRTFTYSNPGSSASCIYILLVYVLTCANCQKSEKNARSRFLQQHRNEHTLSKNILETRADVRRFLGSVTAHADASDAAGSEAARSGRSVSRSSLAAQKKKNRQASSSLVTTSAAAAATNAGSASTDSVDDQDIDFVEKGGEGSPGGGSIGSEKEEEGSGSGVDHSSSVSSAQSSPGSSRLAQREQARDSNPFKDVQAAATHHAMVQSLKYHKLWLRFVDPEMERTFRHQVIKASRVLPWRKMMLTCSIFVMFGVHRLAVNGDMCGLSTALGALPILCVAPIPLIQDRVSERHKEIIPLILQAFFLFQVMYLIENNTGSHFGKAYGAVEQNDSCMGFPIDNITVWFTFMVVLNSFPMIRYSRRCMLNSFVATCGVCSVLANLDDMDQANMFWGKEQSWLWNTTVNEWVDVSHLHTANLYRVHSSAIETVVFFVGSVACLCLNGFRAERGLRKAFGNDYVLKKDMEKSMANSTLAKSRYRSGSAIDMVDPANADRANQDIQQLGGELANVVTDEPSR